MTKLCPRCRTPAAVDAPFCAACGHRYRTYFPPPADQTLPVRPQKRRRPGALLVLGILTATFLSLALVVILSTRPSMLVGAPAPVVRPDVTITWTLSSGESTFGRIRNNTSRTLNHLWVIAESDGIEERSGIEMEHVTSEARSGEIKSGEGTALPPGAETHFSLYPVRYFQIDRLKVFENDVPNNTQHPLTFEEVKRPVF